MSHITKTTTDIPNILRSIEVRPIFRHEQSYWDRLMHQYHYLGFKALIGESIRYIATYQRNWLALLGWSSAALKCTVRDQWIGWPCVLKTQRLNLLANNTRFLILPHIHVSNLASRILALNLKRLSDDWQRIHGHPVLIAETFVDPRYYRGTCYKAAGWTFLGYTSGYSKRYNHYIHNGNPKMVFVRLLCKDAKTHLKSPYLKFTKEVKTMKLSKKDTDELIKLLSEIPEPRMPRGIRHRKLSIIAISICAIISNARSFAAIAEWAQRCSQNMLLRLRCRYNKKTKRYEPPSEPTIRRFLQKLDPAPVDKSLYAWIQSLAPNNSPVGVDGKTLKGAKKEDGRKVHLLSAFLHEQGTVLAQCEVESKTNEIPMVPVLLENIDMQGRAVTLDAMHTQKQTARYLVEDKHADYLFIVKENQKSLLKDIKDLNMVSFPPSTPNNR
ncbi:MAG: ISAs1 family transposase [Candidatus Scalindua sp.]